MEFDEVDCNAGMSAAHAVAKSVIDQCLRERFPDTAFAVIHQASQDLAYDIAFGQRHEQTLPVIAAQAAGAAFNLVQADLDKLGRFLAHSRPEADMAGSSKDQCDHIFLPEEQVYYGKRLLESILACYGAGMVTLAIRAVFVKAVRERYLPSSGEGVES